MSSRLPRTSYWGLRDYGVDGQLGLERTPEEYVANMVEVFRAVRRVLRKDGVAFLNLGDSYASGEVGRHDAVAPTPGGPTYKSLGAAQGKRQQARLSTGLKSKDLVGIPWRVAFALQADGWYLRSDIIWSKPNPMPESVTDRCTKSHEYVFMLTRSERYYFDAEAIKEMSAPSSEARAAYSRSEPTPSAKQREHLATGSWNGAPAQTYGGGRNRRSVWHIATQPFPGAHFAVMPPALVEPCILAGTSERGCCAECGAPWGRVVEYRSEPNAGEPRGKAGVLDESGIHHGQNGRRGVPGSFNNNPRLRPPPLQTTGWQPTCAHAEAPLVPCTVLDPFTGSGTVGEVAIRLGRSAVLIELNPTYAEMARRRCADAPLSLFGVSPAEKGAEQ